MNPRRILVLNDPRGMLARRGALALEVPGSLHFPDYYGQIVEDGLIADVVWLRWARKDPLWRGENDGAFLLWRFSELQGVSVGLAEHLAECGAATVFDPERCHSDACTKLKTDRCFRILNSTPLKPCDCQKRASREIDLPTPSHN